MDYKLFDDYITLQALLKDLRIIQSGGAIKSFLADNTVLVNGEDEKRRGKKVRSGDMVELPNQDLVIKLMEPSQQDRTEFEADQAEKARVAAIVKKLNQDNKKTHKPQQNKTKKIGKQDRRPVRFPGT